MPRTVFSPSTFARIGITQTTKATRKAIDRGLFRAAQQGKNIAIQAIRNTKPRPPIDTGELASSYVVLRQGRGWVLRNTAPHAVFMEFGTKPHTPPFAPLLAWARRKVRGSSGAKQTQAKKRHRQRRQGLSKKATLRKPGQQISAKRRAAHQGRQQNLDAVRLARAAMNSIQRRGTVARGFHARASQKFAVLSAKLVQDEIRRVR